MGAAKSLSVRNISSIRRALPPDAFAEIERSLVPAATSELLGAFDAWLSAETTRALYRETVPQTAIGRAMATVPGWENQRAAEYYHLRETVAAKFPEIISRFDDLLERRRHFQLRGELAYVRILAPLLDSAESGLIERRWQEMSDSELRRFVQAGIERESILLDRPPDLQRAQEVAARDPIEFIALYGQEWDIRAFYGRGIHPLMRRWISKRRSEVERQGQDT